MERTAIMGQITRVTKKTDNRFLNFYELDTVKKTGKPGRYFLSSRARTEEDLEIRTHADRADGVMMFMLYGEQHDRIVLIRQYRFPIDGFIYELPAGLVEDGEDLHEGAIREVLEETGLELELLEVDPSFEKAYYTTVGMTDESVSLVYGYASGDLGHQHLEDSEEITVVLADREEARRILKEERISLAAAYTLMHFINDEDPFAFLKA